MNTKKNKYPVLLITYKRLKDLGLILKEIERYRPPVLYIYSDAGRNIEEQKDVKIVRDFLTQYSKGNTKINCKVYCNKLNKGVRDGIYHAVNNVLKNEKALIVLEDDCVPTKGFFMFCSYYLSLFEKDKRVLSISGTRFGKRGNPLLSKYFTSWGWATWQNRWKMLDLKLKDWEKMRFFQKVKFLYAIHRNVLGVWYWYNILEYTRWGKIVAWDYQFNFLHWLKGGYSVVPSANLVTNNGFDMNSTNTTLVHKHIPRAKSKSTTLTRSVNLSVEYDHLVLNNFYLYYLPVLGLIIKYMFGFKNFTYIFNKIRYKINFARRNKMHS